ncbi:class I SAM-dependent DNA methyltransferase, partial [Tsukamurella sp. NPDC003166]
TLIPALIPPGAAHVDGIYSLGVPDDLPTLVALTGSMSSLISDFAVRVAPKSTIRSGTASRLPCGFTSETLSALMLRVLRLNCVTNAYAEIWQKCFDDHFHLDAWAKSSAHGLLRGGLGDVTHSWTDAIPLRSAVERRQALIEIDALVALSVGATADELCAIYRTQFPVLYGYDTRGTFYDVNGRSVPSAILALWRRRGMNSGNYTNEELSSSHPGSGLVYRYETPFISLDREQDLQFAFAVFADRLGPRP